MASNPYNFEEFTSFGSKFSPIISLGKTGGFGFSSGFYNRYNLKGSVAMKLFYDKERMVVAFKFFKTPENGAVELKDQDRGGYVPVRSFLNKYDIDPAKYANRYIPKEIDDESLGKIYAIELKERIRNN